MYNLESNTKLDEWGANFLVHKALIRATRKVNKHFIKRKQQLYETYVKPDLSSNGNNNRQDPDIGDISRRVQLGIRDPAVTEAAVPTERSVHDSLGYVPHHHGDDSLHVPLSDHIYDEVHEKHVQEEKEHLLQHAAHLKESSEQLEQKAMALDTHQHHVSGENMHHVDNFHLQQQDIVDPNKIEHIKSGENGQGPERGGSFKELPFKHAPGYVFPMGITSNNPMEQPAIHYVNTGYPEFNLPTEAPCVEPNEHTELVPPPPPVGGPNPYEVLTSSTLGGGPPPVANANAGAGPVLSGAVPEAGPDQKPGSTMKVVLSIKKPPPCGGQKREIKNKSEKTTKRHYHKHGTQSNKKKTKKNKRRKHRSSKNRKSHTVKRKMNNKKQPDLSRTGVS